MKKIFKLSIIFALILLGYLNINCKTYAYTAGQFSVKLSSTKYTYDGKEKKPRVIVKYAYTSRNVETLVSGIDYEITYKNNKNVGNGYVIINIHCYINSKYYKKTLYEKFTISKKSLKKCTISLSSSSFVYDGTEKKPKVSIKGLKINKDYTVTYSHNKYPNSSDPAPCVTIKGNGNYKDTVRKNFTIQKTDVSRNCKITFKDDLTKKILLNKGSAKPEIKSIKYNSFSLEEGTDYSVEYKNNTIPGTASIIIKGIGYCTGKYTKKFKIGLNIANADIHITKKQTYSNAAKF